MTNIAFLTSGTAEFAATIHQNLPLIEGLNIAVVLSDKPCGGVEYFQQHTNIPTVMLDYEKHNRDENDAAIVEALKQHGAEYVLLNFNRLVGSVLLDAYPQRVFNHHPGLLPAFKKFGAQRRAYEHSTLFYGSTIHDVDLTVDEGPILMQFASGKQPNEAFENFAKRHFAYTALLCLDFLYKLHTDTLIESPHGNQRLFQNAVYGQVPFNPQLSINPQDVRFIDTTSSTQTV